MFDFSWSELLLIGLVALIFIGPKELPGVLRTLGQWMSKIRRMAGDFQNQFHDAMREAELADLKKEVDEMAAHAANYTNFDPLDDVRKQAEMAQRDIEGALAGTAADPAAQAPPAQAPATESAAAVGAGAQEHVNEHVNKPAKESVTEPKHSAAGSEPA
jgi:sec-independent protein translocase protein TatB